VDAEPFGWWPSALVLGLQVALSPVYRDFFRDHRDRYRGASYAANLGPMEYDRQVMREFSWGGVVLGSLSLDGHVAPSRPGYAPALPGPTPPGALPDDSGRLALEPGHVLIKSAGLVLLCAALS